MATTLLLFKILAVNLYKKQSLGPALLKLNGSE